MTVRSSVGIGPDQPLDVLAPLEGDRSGQRDRGAAVHEQPRQLGVAVEGRLIKRRQPNGILDIQVGPEIDEGGK